MQVFFFNYNKIFWRFFLFICLFSFLQYYQFANMDYSKNLSSLFPGCKINVSVGFSPQSKCNNQNPEKMTKQKVNQEDQRFQKEISSYPIGSELPPNLFYSLMKKGNFFESDGQQFGYLGIQPYYTSSNAQFKQQNPISDDQFNKILDETIYQIRCLYSHGDPLFQSQKLQNIIKKDKQKLIKYSHLGYSKPGAVWMIGQSMGMIQQISPQTINKILQKSVIPLFSAIAGKYLFDKKDNRWEQLLQNGIKYNQPFAFQYLGEAYEKQKQYLKAFQMFKASEQQGFQYSAWLHISNLYIHGSDGFPCNTFRAYEYEKKVAQRISYPKQCIPSQEVYFRYSCQNIIQREKEKKLLSALLVSTYLENDLQELKSMGKKLEPCFQKQYVNQFRQNLRTNSGERQRVQKNFEIVFKLKQPKGMFLAYNLDMDCLQIVVINNWDEILNKSQLAAVFVEGLKIKLRYFSSSYNGCIAYVRAQFIEKIKQQYISKHQISIEKLKEYGKHLLTNNYQKQSVPIYNHLIEKEANQLSIMYSNKGLAFDLLNKFEEAEKMYKKSLQTYDYQKSKLRLGYLYIKMKLVEKALEITKQVNDLKEKSLLLQKINQIKPKQKQNK